MIDPWLLLALGFGVGTIGTLIGVGGGFILVPVLIVLMPRAAPSAITAVSLAVVFLSATSGSIAYIRMRRVDLESAAVFALATLPGAVVGVFGTNWVPRRQFEMTFGALLVLASAYLVLRPVEPRAGASNPQSGRTKREITDAEGTTHSYSFSIPAGIILSLAVGFVSSLLGIGGGIIHVPVLNRVLNFPVHIATATSQVILGFMALVGAMVHLAEGNLEGNMPMVALLGGGAIIGAQAGAQISRRVHGLGIMRILALAIALVGARMLLMNSSH